MKMRCHQTFLSLNSPFPQIQNENVRREMGKCADEHGTQYFYKLIASKLYCY